LSVRRGKIGGRANGDRKNEGETASLHTPVDCSYTAA
jgi:hypothetical protein